MVYGFANIVALGTSNKSAGFRALNERNAFLDPIRSLHRGVEDIDGFTITLFMPRKGEEAGDMGYTPW